jgi:hypothetical protein
MCVHASEPPVCKYLYVCKYMSVRVRTCRTRWASILRAQASESTASCDCFSDVGEENAEGAVALCVRSGSPEKAVREETVKTIKRSKNICNRYGQTIV